MSEPSGFELPDSRRVRSSGPWWGCVLGISLLAGAVGFGTAQFGGGDSFNSGSEPASAPVPFRGQESRSAQPALDRVALYYIGKDNGMLYREFRELPGRGGPTSTAVLALTGVAPLDPDYETFWSPASWVRISETAGMISIDLPADAFRNISSNDRAQRAVAQLSSTLVDSIGEERAGKLDLQLLMEGSPELPEVFGGASRYSIAKIGLKPAVWLTEPANQSMVQEGRIRIAGLVRPGSLAPTLVVKDVRSGRRTQAEIRVVGQQSSEWNHWEAEVEAFAGAYEVTVSASQGGVVSSDSRTLKVASAGQ